MKVLKKLHQLGTNYLSSKFQLAEVLLKRALVVNRRFVHDEEMFGNVYNSLAMAYEDQKRFDDASFDYRRATLIARKQG